MKKKPGLHLLSKSASFMFVCFFCMSCFSSISLAYENKQLTALFDAEWQSRMERSPRFAESTGDKSQAAKLADVSEQAQQKWLTTSKIFLNQLKDIKQSSLDPVEQINYQIFRQQLVNRITQLTFKDYQIPFFADSGFHTYIARLPVETEFKNIIDYENYLTRLTLVPEFFQQHIMNMNAGLKRGFSMPKIVMTGFTDVIHEQIKDDVSLSAFYAPFKQISDQTASQISSQQLEKLKSRAKSIILKKVNPAYQELASYFAKTYIPMTKQSLAAKDFPEGDAYYQHKIKQYTTGELNSEAIHKIGLAEVKRIRSEMDEIIRKLEFQGSFKDFLLFLRTSEQFYAKSAEELLKEASFIAKKMDGQLPKFFTKLPRQPYTVEAVPASIAPKYTTGRYVSAPLDSTRPGTYWVNTYALDKRPLYVLESLTLHEAVPGHHLQLALTQELENIPKFRKHSYISVFGEGWALYCEKLGIEAGFYKDPYSQFGRLSYEMWRAARLVIDTGIHSFAWSREKAIKLLEDNSALSKHNIQTEVDRYISWPGQALSYKLGELKILALRQRAEQELGSKFDIRLFHDAILANGSIPLDVLEHQIDGFIKDQLLEK